MSQPNTFNILQNHNINDTSSAGADNPGEWIQGGAYLEVVTGTTTLNQSWGNDQPFYVYYSSGGSTLQVDAGAAMVWNLNRKLQVQVSQPSSSHMNSYS